MEEKEYNKNENKKPLIGEKFPDFELDAFYNKEIKKVKLSDYKGKWLVFIFYPADFTFICPTELEAAADNYSEFQNLGAEIISVSTDKVFSHKAWKDASSAIKKINFPMMSDPAGKLCKTLGIYLEDEGISLRATFIVDPEGIIKSCEIHDNDIGRNIKETIRKLQAIKFVRENKGQVCPVNWEPGKKTLKPDIDLIGKI